MLPPQSGHSFGVNQLENALLPLHPLDVPGTGVFVLQQLQQKLPQVGGVAWKKTIIHNVMASAYKTACTVYKYLNRPILENNTTPEVENEVIQALPLNVMTFLLLGSNIT